MRIGFVTQEYPPFVQGGAGTYAERIVENLARRGHEVVVFAPRRPSPMSRHEKDGITVVPIVIPGTPLSMAVFWSKLGRAVLREEREGGFDVVHVNSVTHWPRGRERIANAPQVMTVHHLSQDEAVLGPRSRGLLGRGENNPLVRRFESQCVRSSDLVIAVSEDTRRKLEARYRLGPRAVTIYEGTDGPPGGDPERPGWRERLDIGGRPVLLFIGRLNDPRKGLDILLRALPMCPQRPVLIAAGRGDAGPALRLARDLGIADSVRTVGFVGQEQLWELYAECDLHVVPSRLEGFGLTVLDAAAAGRRVVATSVGAIPEICGPGATLVEPGDPGGLAEGILRALSSPGPSEEAMRAHASRFSWSRATAETERAYRDAMDAFSGRDAHVRT